MMVEQRVLAARNSYLRSWLSDSRPTLWTRMGSQRCCGVDGFYWMEGSFKFGRLPASKSLGVHSESQLIRIHRRVTMLVADGEMETAIGLVSREGCGTPELPLTIVPPILNDNDMYSLFPELLVGYDKGGPSNRVPSAPELQVLRGYLTMRRMCCSVSLG
ncbi:hypothetical protein E1B28_003751 [Marasmius oreades]|uniref:Uncharacterized protein n=1 Tax=Marasmius oreades TaxID=181124 RepID=A0A9P7UX94_9AGAR|nr:uncharacterized protein E1B28_003751 [Marasmius oreades]KAG7096305.1 hypothetical protein E1B28_003751 [Marasmius oreades]